MKVITVKSKESLSPDIQRDIHYTLRMEHQSDYVIRDIGDAQYSATISLENPSEAVDLIVSKSSEIPEYTILIDIVDVEANKIERMVVKNGRVEERKSGSWEWEVKAD